ncbi:MAG: hypothetical protein ACREVR_11715 [Burkholderiales bacterium]
MTNAFAQQPRRWYSDRATLSSIGFKYLPWLGLLNLLWEIAQLPLYTVWAEGSLPYLAYVVVHCTLGDLVIGVNALAFALVATRAGALDDWKFRKVGLLTVITGIGYTVLSEWLNTIARPSWEYSALMPVINLNGLKIGLSPLLQWLVIPPVALWLAGFRPVKRAEANR